MFLQRSFQPHACPGMRNLGPGPAAGRSQVGGCRLRGKLGRAASPLTWEMLQSNFRRRISPHRITRSTGGSRGGLHALPGPGGSPRPLPGLGAAPEIAGAGGTALRRGKRAREAGGQAGCSPLPPKVQSSRPPPPQLSPCRPPRLPGALRVTPKFQTPRPYPPDCLRGPLVLSRRRGAGPGEREPPGPPGLRS